MKKKTTDSTNGLFAKLKKTKNKALKTERKIESSGFNIGRMIILGFWGIVAGVCLFSFLAFSRTGFLNEKINGYQAEAKEQIEMMNKSGFITSPAAEDYAERFTKEYITIPFDSKQREKRAAQLSNFLAEGLSLDNMESIAEFQGKRVIDDIKLYGYEDIKEDTATILYRIQYSSTPINQEVIKEKQGKGKEAKEVEKVITKEGKVVRKVSLIAVPIGTDGQNFNVIEQPYFKQLPQDTKITAITNDSTKDERNYRDEAALKEFTSEFLTSLTQNTVKEMGYLMEQPESLEGVYEYLGINEFTLFNGKNGEYEIKAYIDFKEISSGIKVRQPLTMIVTSDNGKYFVEKIKYSIGG